MKVVIYFVLAFAPITAVIADYIAAVAQHAVFLGIDSDSSDFKLQKNLEIYKNLTALAKSKGAQILVFPEFGLTATGGKVRSDLYPFAERIADVQTPPQIPCENPSFTDESILSTMSCAAKENQIAISVNMIDWVDCNIEIDSNCPTDNHYQYNTDVVFE
jgi:predicted amidohydrolase